MATDVKKTRFIFVTGGVVSSLGKGIAAATLGAVLESRGLKVSVVKLDPYINVDAGAMSPFQHGEIYVTREGAETDLDLGHYERFLKNRSTSFDDYTTGQIYNNVISRERAGGYEGGTVQVIPHITNEIKRCITKSGEGSDVCLVEIGGTVGDIEGLPFLEAIRQFSIELGREHAFFMHLTLVPYLDSAGEIKTKPTQHAVKELRSIGLQPDVLVCRTDRPLPEAERSKIALFANISMNRVITAVDVDDIYRMPRLFQNQGLDELVVQQFGLDLPAAELDHWDALVEARKNPEASVTVAMVGKYVELADAYKSVNEALAHAGLHTKTDVQIKYIDSEQVGDHVEPALEGVDAILVPGGFGGRGIEGKIAAARYARENNIPYFGISLGMQVATIDFARNVAGIAQAHSTEFDKQTPAPVICLPGEATQESKAPMRLGEQVCQVVPNTLTARCYDSAKVYERHRNRYEFNNQYRKQLEDKGMVIAGTHETNGWVEIIELPNHPWFIGCQFHPEFNSTPHTGHPLFIGFIKAAREQATK